MRRAARIACQAVRVFCLGELPAQSMDLRELVVGGPRRSAARGLCELIAGVPGLVLRIRPEAAQHLDLGAPDETLPAIRNQVGLGLAPVAERLGPFLHAAHVEQLEAGLDDAAVDGADDDGRELARGDGHHHLVHQRDALVHRAEPHDRAGTTLLGQVDQVPVAETLADDDRLREDVAGLLEVSFHDGLDRGGHEQVAALHAVGPCGKKAFGTRCPTGRTRHLATSAQFEDQPDRAPGGAQRVALGEEGLMRARERVLAGFVSTAEVRRHAQMLEVLPIEGRLGISGRQLCVCRIPRAPKIGLAAFCQCLGPAHCVTGQV